MKAKGGVIMENEQLLIKMVQKLAASMDEIKQEMKDFRTEMKHDMDDFRSETRQDIADFRSETRQDMDDLKSEISQDIDHFKSEVKQEINHFKSEVNLRFDYIDERFGTVVEKLESLGDMFEHTVMLKQESIDEVKQTLQYHSHKIAEHDEEIFHLKNKH